MFDKKKFNKFFYSIKVKNEEIVKRKILKIDYINAFNDILKAFTR